MKETVLNLAAMCDKAGRPMNQDNFFVCQDLSSATFIAVNNDDKDISLSEKGTLVVVADGMGGMSAGEVASKIVVESIKSDFHSIPLDILNDDVKIKRFIVQAIVNADREIKLYAKEHPETSGMGSTVVVLWIINDKAYVGWCGDSRAYCYNSQNRLVRLTHDHSYVQDLVDQKKISEEEAFEHPDSNIITRSLGDSGQRANPDVEMYPIHSNDIFLLCSDGLCGLLRDSEIQSIISANDESMKSCLMALWNQGTRTGWTDNATVELVKIKKCTTPASSNPVGWLEKHTSKDLSEQEKKASKTSSLDRFERWSKKSWIYLACATFVMGVIVGFLIGRINTKEENIMQNPEYEKQIFFYQKEIESMNAQIESLQNEIEKNRNQAASQSVNTPTRGSEVRTRVEHQGTPSNRKETPQQKAPEQPNVSTQDNQAGLTPAHESTSPDCSKIDDSYLSLIDNTIGDYEGLKKKIAICNQHGNVSNIEEYEMLKLNFTNLSNNISAIQENCSYEYLKDKYASKKAKIEEILENYTTMEGQIKELNPRRQTSVTLTIPS